MANGLDGNENQDIDVLIVFTMILDTLNAFKIFEIGTDRAFKIFEIGTDHKGIIILTLGILC